MAKKYQFSIQKINLDDLKKFLIINNIEHEYENELNCFLIGLHDNLIYFYDNEVHILDNKNINFIISDIKTIIRRIPSYDRLLFKQIKLTDLEKILLNQNIEYEFKSYCITFKLYDNLIYFYENRYQLHKNKNKDLIIDYLSGIINKLSSYNNNIELNKNYINNENKFIILNKNHYFSACNVDLFSII